MKDLQASNKVAEIKDPHHLWDLGGKESCVAFAVSHMASLICSQFWFGYWAFCWDDNHIESFYPIIGQKLSPPIRCSGRLVFVLIWPQTRCKQKRARTKAWSASTIDWSTQRVSQLNSTNLNPTLWRQTWAPDKKPTSLLMASWCLAETVCDQNKPEWDDLYCRSIRQAQNSASTMSFLLH